MPAPLNRLEPPDRALAGDLLLAVASCGFAAVTAAASTLAPHRAWGEIAMIGYAVASLVAIIQLVTGRVAAPASGTGARVIVTVAGFGAVGLIPLVIQAAQRAAGRADRAQEEVTVVEEAGRRLLETGSPYLDRAAIAALPEPERLLGYTPYQPGMALFGVPRALAGVCWWSDARVWFAVATIAALAASAVVLSPARRGAARDTQAAAGVRALQAITVLPLSALTLATGGDDLPVLALCLLGLALATRDRFGWAGVALGAAGALKLFAWPIAVVTLALAVTRGGAGLARPWKRFAPPAFCGPLLVLLPATLVDPAAAIENVVRFPLGRGLVGSPAQSPLPGRLIAESIPAGRAIALGLLATFAALLAVWLLRRPPRTAAAAAAVCAFGLTGAILLLPATRFGYFLYPVAFAFAIPALRRPPGLDSNAEASA